MTSTRGRRRVEAILAAGGLALTLAGVVFPWQAVAQGAAIEEVIVTAERREQRLQEVPISITAHSADYLEAMGAQGTEDLMMLTPGLNMSQVGSPQIALRGISTSNLNLSGDPGVGFYIDGIYVARASGQFLEFWDLERIEVLRGPQGTLYGRNTPGGVVHIINRGAGPETDAYAKVELGSYWKRRFEGAAGGTLVKDRLFGRIALVKDDHDGYADNLFDGDDVDDKDLFGARGSLLFQPTDSLSFDARFEYAERDDTGPVFKALEPGLANIMGGTSPFNDDRDINVDRPFERVVKNYGLSLRTDWEVGQWTLTSITGWRRNEFTQTGDLDDTELDTAWFDSDSDSETFQQEFQVTSSHWDRLQWIAGAFLWWEEADAFLAFPFPAFGVIPINSPEIDTFSVAGFAQGTLFVTDRLRLTAGVRYTHDDKDFMVVQDVLPFFSGLVRQESRKDNAWTPRFGIDFFLTDDIMWYASATRGFKSGGFNAAGVGPTYDPEFLWAYETGIKGTLFDGRLQANLSGFYYDYTDVQILQIVQAGSFLVNAAEATVKGAEVELFARPNERLLLNVGLSFIDSEFENFMTFDPILDLQVPGGAGLQDLSGNRLPRAPKFSGNVGIEYTIPLAEYGELAVRGDYQHRGRMYFDHFNRLRNSEGDVDLFNLRAAWRLPGGHWEVAAYGRNLGDETYASSKFEIPESLGTVLATMAPPRTWGVELTWRY